MASEKIQQLISILCSVQVINAIQTCILMQFRRYLFEFLMNRAKSARVLKSLSTFQQTVEISESIGID